MSNLLEKASIITTPTAYSEGVLHSVKPEQTLGSELITNGDFATDSDWGKGTGWSISNNTAISDGSTTSGSIISQTINIVEGKTYQVTVDVDSVDSGRIRFYSNFLGSGGQADITSSGAFTYNLKASETGGRNIGVQARDVGTQAVINSVSVKQLINADFTFTRGADLATRVNSSGNIESVGVDLPRIDYRGGCGSLLLEPQATNTATDSNDFTTGDIFVSSSDPSLSNVVLTSAQATSPDGNNNAWKLVDDNAGGTAQCGLNYFSTNVISENYNTVSLFVKKQGDNDWVYINNFGYDATSRSWFNISNGTLGTVASGHTASIDDYGNGWYRIAITFTTEFDLAGSINIRLSTSDGATNILRDGTNGVYIYGLQAESHATRQHATSYIPTSGDIQTRAADSAIDAGSSDLINSTEGVLYAEISALSNELDGTYKVITLNNGIVDEYVLLGFTNINNIYASVGGTFISSLTPTDATDFHKVAIKYEDNNSKLFVNGVQVGLTNTTATVPSGLNNLDFDTGTGGSPFKGNVKCVAVFQEALTDAELEALTTI